MPFEIVLSYLKQGHCVKRVVWDCEYIILDGTSISLVRYGAYIKDIDLKIQDILANDWEALG